MKLTFTRSQKHWTDEVHFELSCQIQFTPEEDKLIQTYRPPEELSGFLHEAEMPLGEHTYVLSVVESDVDDALDKETEIEEACKALLRYLKRAQAYSGQVEHDL